MKRIFLIVALIIGQGMSLKLCADALDLELTRGMVGAIPIAVVPFSHNNSQAARTISDVISQDLRHSGWFQVTDADKLPQTPDNMSDMQWSAWEPLKLNAVVLGQVTPLPSGQWRVSFSLLDAVSATSKNPEQSAILLQRNLKADPKALRHMAHHISDLVYEQLTGDPGVFTTRIAYVLKDMRGKTPEYTLAISDIDGRGQQDILHSKEPLMSPTWRPDGRALAYVTFEKGEPTVVEQSLETGKRRVISSAPGVNSAPAYSPDGQQMALVRTTSGYPKIYLMQLATGQLRQITQGWSIDTEPRWAPDGQGLYFTSNRGGNVQIYYVSLADDQVRRVTFEGSYNSSARVSPDGESIIMLHKDGDAFDIVKQDLQSGELTLLTHSRNGQSPTLAPNGKLVMYAAPFGEEGVLEMVATNGRVSTRLPARNMSVQEPSWSPYLYANRKSPLTKQGAA